VYISADQIGGVKAEVECTAEDGFHHKVEAGISDVIEHAQSAVYQEDELVKCEAEPDSNNITEHPDDEEPRSHLCTVCDKRFPTNSTLIIHSRTHSGEKPFLCTVCDKRFAWKYNLTRHIRTHTGEKPYKCPICSKCFRYNNLSTHKQTHNTRKCYQCSVCEKQFSTSRGCRVHMNIHKDKYSCTICGKCFGNSGGLMIHGRIHSGEKLFECTVCKKCFTTQGELVVHNRIHSGQRPYNCHVCAKVFTTFGSLIRHLRIHTNENLSHVQFVINVLATPVDYLATCIIFTVVESHTIVLIVVSSSKLSIS